MLTILLLLFVTWDLWVWLLYSRPLIEGKTRQRNEALEAAHRILHASHLELTNAGP